MTPRPQSLVCLTTSAALGGAETSLLTLLGALRTQEPSWRICLVSPADGPLLARCAALGVDTMVWPYPKPLRQFGESAGGASSAAMSARARFVAQGIRVAPTLPGYVSGLRRLLRERGATVVHTNGVKAHVAGALAKTRGARLVWHLHDYVQPRPVSSQLLRRLVRRADAIVTNSDSVRNDAAVTLGNPGGLRRVYNAVDLQAFSPDGPRADLADAAGMAADRGCLRIGLVATLARWKGQDVFIDAISRMHARDRIRAYIIGGAVYGTTGSQWAPAELKARADGHGLSDVIGFTGHVDDVPSAMRSLDILVHASTSPEPFGMVIAEGMASARAVVAARAGGALELFEDRVTAAGHEPGDAVQLAQTLDELASNGEWRSRLGTAARAAACRRFSADRMAAEFREVYQG
jgi:glycosyltransferase involved in cell wall biosynthesis